MLLTEYLQDFAKTIAEYAETGLIIASELKLMPEPKRLA